MWTLDLKVAVFGFLGSKPVHGPEKDSDLSTVTQPVHDKVISGLLSLQPGLPQICLSIPT